MLGFDEVRSLCLTVAVMGSLLKGKPRAELTKEMSRAFHAAVQARSLAFQRGDAAAEELFTSALLYRLGDLAFWCFGGESADEVIEMMNQTGCSAAEAERQVLGFELKELTLGLSKAWGIGPLLEEAFAEEHMTDSRWSVVALSHRLVRAAEESWVGEEIEALTVEAATYAAVTPAQMTDMLHANAEEAVSVAKGFGARHVGEVIPTVASQSGNSPPARTAVGILESIHTATVKEVIPLFEPDPTRQLSVLREISSRLEAGTDAHEILELILEGIHKGVGMDRAVFALLSPNRKYLRGKTALGRATEGLLGRFKFDVRPEQPNVFHFVIESQSALWVPDREAAAMKKLIPESVSSVIGESPFFVAPTIVAGKPIGVFYSDRQPSGRECTHEDYESFKQFAIQAELALAHLETVHSRGEDPRLR
jgi:hypothetical protein